jgi:hypothetical protein
MDQDALKEVAASLLRDPTTQKLSKKSLPLKKAAENIDLGRM